MRGAFLFQAIRQLLPHLNDAVSHTMDLLQPALIDKKKKNHKRSINMYLEHMPNTSAYLKKFLHILFRKYACETFKCNTRVSADQVS